MVYGYRKLKHSYFPYFTGEDMKEHVKNACVFPRDLYVLCSLVPTSGHIIKRTLDGSLKVRILFIYYTNNECL